MLTAGMASALFILTKSLVQLPLATMWTARAARRDADLRNAAHGRRPIIYLSGQTASIISPGRADLRLGSGLAYPTWLWLWSVNLDPGRESFQWSIYHTSTGMGTAATGAAGAAMASRWVLRHLPVVRPAVHCRLPGAFDSGAARAGQGKGSVFIRPFSVGGGGSLLRPPSHFSFRQLASVIARPFKSC